MKPVRIKPIELVGVCPLGITADDEFYIIGLELINKKNSKICFASVAHFYYGIWNIQGEKMLVNHTTCPGCINNINDENRVSFQLAFDENWKLGEIITKYYKLMKIHEEPKDAKKLRLLTEKYLIEPDMDYEFALRGMKTALKIFIKCTGAKPKIKVF